MNITYTKVYDVRHLREIMARGNTDEIKPKTTRVLKKDISVTKLMGMNPTVKRKNGKL